MQMFIFNLKFVFKHTAKRGQFVVSHWAIFNPITKPVSIDASSIYAAVLMTLTCYIGIHRLYRLQF